MRIKSSLRRHKIILNVGESTQDVGEQRVGETTRRRNDRNSIKCMQPAKRPASSSIELPTLPRNRGM